MKLLKIKRQSKYEKRHSVTMGKLTTRVTYIKKYLMGFPVRTLHKYRQTYDGKVKDCKACNVSA